MRIRDCTLGADDSVHPQNTVFFVNLRRIRNIYRADRVAASTRRFHKKAVPRLPDGSRGAVAYLVLLQPVQLSSGLMHGSFFPGKNASIGKSIWLKTSQGLSVLVPPTGGQVFDGTQ